MAKKKVIIKKSEYKKRTDTDVKKMWTMTLTEDELLLMSCHYLEKKTAIARAFKLKYVDDIRKEAKRRRIPIDQYKAYILNKHSPAIAERKRKKV